MQKLSRTDLLTLRGLTTVLFSATLARMWFTPEIEQESPFTETAAERLSQVESEFEKAEQEFDDSCRALAAHDAFRVRLSAALDHARTRRAHLLFERAALLKVVEGK